MYEDYRECDTPEQDAFQDYIYGAVGNNECGYRIRSLKKDREAFASRNLNPEIEVIPQRKMDSFWRPGFNDPLGAKWYPGDLAAHISGIRDQDRILQMDLLQKNILKINPSSDPSSE